MKKIKFFALAMISMATLLVSCSGDDGEQGPQGPQGVPGVNGNANVQAFSVDVSNWDGGSTLIFNIPDQLDKSKFTFLFYLKTSVGGYVFPVPGASLEGGFNTTLFYLAEEEDQLGDASILFFDSVDGLPFNMPSNVFSEVLIVAIEIGTSAKNGNVNVLSELKAVGVNTSDYHAVAAYFGLD
ncbi:hypothetical protein [Flagellimonas beolgyonensis]|uniref:hypothetical protein n=1 Tax=Flagellimonas beolgyonensis TaxID=864064 RepID=UPI000F8EEE3D|nr:hypothetical protein [Allomuricauda beolgyonensis]